jgi:hypothetical protein
MTLDPLALVYAGLQVYKLYKDDARFEAEMAALKARVGNDPDAILAGLHELREQAAKDAHKAFEVMP